MAKEENINGHTVDHLLRVAEDVVTKKTSDSKILDAEAEERIPKFELSELTIGKVLGRGGFCVVNEVIKIELNDKQGEEPKRQLDDEHCIHNIIQDRNFMKVHCVRDGKDYRYAIKRLQDTTRKDAQTFVNGVVDLAIEARFLAIVRHPNIIKMRAMAASSPFDGQFFLILDKLYDILPGRIKKWQKTKPSGLKKLMDRGGKRASEAFVERLTVGYDLSCALKYLHDHNIIYRDLKPDNIGFDVRNDVKIFDFGLAKEFNPANANTDGMYLMTGDTGSPRYMADEVALSKPYNETVDVYSFCILLWQILKLETPFDGYTMSMFRKNVVVGGARPKCDPKWPQELCATMKLGWGPAKNRPNMEDVCVCLRDEINRNSDEELEDVVDASRKSAMSLHNGR